MFLWLILILLTGMCIYYIINKPFREKNTASWAGLFIAVCYNTLIIRSITIPLYFLALLLLLFDDAVLISLFITRFKEGKLKKSFFATKAK